MLESQKTQLRLSETRSQMNEMGGPFHTIEEADLPKYEKLQAELKAIEVEYRNAIEAEAVSSDVAFNADTPENRERRDITTKADLGVLVGAFVSRRSLKRRLG